MAPLALLLLLAADLPVERDPRFVAAVDLYKHAELRAAADAFAAVVAPTDEERALVLAWVGVCRGHANDLAGARVAFDDALALNVDLTLPTTSSPVVVDVFQAAQDRAKRARAVRMPTSSGGVGPTGATPRADGATTSGGTPDDPRPTTHPRPASTEDATTADPTRVDDAPPTDRLAPSTIGAIALGGVGGVAALGAVALGVATAVHYDSVTSGELTQIDADARLDLANLEMTAAVAVGVLAVVAGGAALALLVLE